MNILCSLQILISFTIVYPLVISIFLPISCLLAFILIVVTCRSIIIASAFFLILSILILIRFTRIIWLRDSISYIPSITSFSLIRSWLTSISYTLLLIYLGLRS